MKNLKFNFLIFIFALTASCSSKPTLSETSGIKPNNEPMSTDPAAPTPSSSTNTSALSTPTTSESVSTSGGSSSKSETSSSTSNASPSKKSKKRSRPKIGLAPTMEATQPTQSTTTPRAAQMGKFSNKEGESLDPKLMESVQEQAREKNEK